jgi:sensor c-di-GMP phosphodiesterase-like protein
VRPLERLQGHAASSLRQAGVDYAQGWLYGQPIADPQARVRKRPAASRRRVVKSSGWSGVHS